MKTYEQPEIRITCEHKDRLNKYPNELYVWTLDHETEEVVVQCYFERIEPWEYLEGIEKPVISKYVEELEEKECFRRLEEPVEICRIPCDMDEEEVVLELNPCKPWEFPVCNEPRSFSWDEDEIDYIEELEEYNACKGDDLFPQNLAICKDGMWWILSLEELSFWEGCFKTLHRISDLSRETLWVGEREDGCQFGLFFNGFDNKCSNLQNEDRWEESVTEQPWTKIEKVIGNLVLLERECDGAVISRMLMDEFETVVAEDTEDDLKEGNSFVMRNEYPTVWVEKGSTMTPVDVEDSTLWGWGKRSEEMEPMLYGNSYIIEDRWGDSFVLRPSGDLLKHTLGSDGIFSDAWEDALILRDNDEDRPPLFCVKKDGLWGVVDESGMIVVPICFMEIRQLYDDDEETDEIWLELDRFDTIRKGKLSYEWISDGDTSMDEWFCSRSSDIGVWKFCLDRWIEQ